MAKKVNVKTLTPASVNELSNYFVATKALISIKAQAKSDKEAVQAKIDALIKARDERLAKGESRDVVIAETDVAELSKELNAIAEKSKKDSKPHLDAQREVYKHVSDNLYPAYVLYMNSASMNAVGTVETGKNTKVKIEKESSYKCVVRDFLNNLGITGLGDDKSVEKAVAKIGTHIGGLRKDSKTGLLKLKSKAEIKDFLIRATIMYLVNDRNILTINEDGSLTKVVAVQEQAQA